MRHRRPCITATGTIAGRAGGRARRLPVVYASSAAVYGDVGDAVAEESRPPAPQTAYGADKYASELHARVGWGVHGVPSFGLRFFNVYGPRQDPASPYSGVISIFADRAARGTPVSVHGDGGQTRDFVYVADVVAHLTSSMRLLGRTPGAHRAYVCPGRETSGLARAEITQRRCRSRAPVAHGPARAGDIRRSVGSPARARALLGVSADVTLADGLARLLVSGGGEVGDLMSAETTEPPVKEQA